MWPEVPMDLVDFGDEKLNYLVEWSKDVLDRNGCNCWAIPVQWGLLKTLVRNEFNDKSFGGLLEVLLTKYPDKHDYGDILHLVRILLVLPISSAQCERTISAVNRIKSDVRNCLDQTTVESLMRISGEGPTINYFNLNPCKARWFSTKRKIKYRGWPNDIELHDDHN